MRISVITPTLDEEQNIPARARDLQAQDCDFEWIVADGGSSDHTVAMASAAGAKIVRSGCGRGTQLAAGVRAAGGDVFVFLHADTQLPPGAFAAIRVAVERTGAIGGNFRLRFDEPSVAGRIFETLYYLQQILTRTYYGDSVIFVQRKTYEAIGGFRDVPILEDLMFVRALERHGRVECIPLFVLTSARRYRGRPLRTFCRWAAITVLFRLGVPPHRLARFYRPHRAGTAEKPV